MFDGWTENSIYYILIFAIYQDLNSPFGYDSACIRFSPLGKEKSHSNSDRRSYILPLVPFNNGPEYVVCKIWDSFPTNKYVAHLLGCPSVHCASQNFNLAIFDIISTDGQLTDKARIIMSKICLPLQPSKLIMHTELEPVRCNTTRLTVNDMVVRKLLSFDYLSRLVIDDIHKLLLKSGKIQELQNIFDFLQKLNVVTVTFRRENVFLSEVHVTFETITEKSWS